MGGPEIGRRRFRVTLGVSDSSQLQSCPRHLESRAHGAEGLKGLVEALRRIGVEAARVCDPAQRSLSPPESEAIPCIAGHLRPLHREVLRSFDLTGDARYRFGLG